MDGKKREITSAIEGLRLARLGDSCLLCGGGPEVIGVFVPHNPRQYGALPGKTRMVRHCLCGVCFQAPDREERVEKIIEVEMTGEIAHA